MLHLILGFGAPFAAFVLSLLAGGAFLWGVVVAQAQPAINTLLKIGNLGSPILFNTIANVGDMSPAFGLKADIVDVTSHSTTVPWRQKITTLLDNGDLSIKLFFIPSSAGTDGQVNQPYGHNGTNGLLSVFTGRQLREYQLVFPDAAATTYYFQAYISKFNIVSKVAGVLEADVTFTLTGQPVLV